MELLFYFVLFLIGDTCVVLQNETQYVGMRHIQKDRKNIYFFLVNKLQF